MVAKHLLVVLAVLLCALVAPNSALAATCAVPGGYATINAALLDNSCDTINVASGTYDEVLDITRSVVINGAGAGTTILAPTSKPNEVLAVRGAAVNVEISGLTIRYASGYYVPGYPMVQSIGVHVYEGATANIHDNTITEIHNDVINGNQTGHCVMVGNNSPASSATVTLRDNTITYCGKQGVSVRANSTVTIDGNTIAHGNKGEGKGTEWQATNAVVIAGNVSAEITGNDIHDWLCPNGTGGAPPSGCAYDIDAVQSYGIIVFGPSTALRVSGNHVHDVDSGYFDYSAGAGPFEFSDNTFEDNKVANVLLTGATETWGGNTIDGAMYGVLVYGATDTALNLAGGNVIRDATVYGLRVFGGPADVSGSKNSFVNNAGGIDVTDASPAELRCNWWGSSSGPTVSGNPGGSGDAVTSNADSSRFSPDDSSFACGTIEPTLAFGSASIEEGSETTLSLTLTNTDASPVGPAQVSFPLPSGFTALVVESSDCGGSVDISSPTVPALSAVTLAGSASCTVTLRVRAVTAGNFTATIPAGGVTAPSGNSPTATSAAILVLARPAPVPPVTPSEPSDTLPACYDKRVIITDVRRRGSRVIVDGFARRAEAGKRVTLRSQLSGRTVARPAITTNGSWRANFAAPARRYWKSNRARYQASLGSSRTIWTKLSRRMATTKIEVAGGVLSINGSATLPLARSTRARIQASYDCGPYRAIGDLRVSRNGRFSGTMSAPTKTEVFFARVRVRVRNSNGLEYSTYSIVQPVVPR